MKFGGFGDVAVVGAGRNDSSSPRSRENVAWGVRSDSGDFSQITSKSYFQRFLYSGMWTLLGTGVARLLTFVMMACLARMLGAEDFGQVGILQSTLSTIGTFAGLGLSNTALRYIAKYKQDELGKCGRIIALLMLVAGCSGFIAGVLSLLFAPLVAGSILHESNLTVPLMIGSPLLFFSMLSGVQTGTIIGFQNFRVLALLSLLDGVLGIVLTLVLVNLFSLEGFALALLLKSISLWLIGQFLASAEWRRNGILLKWRDAWAEWRILLGFSLPAFLSSVSYAPILWAGQTLLIQMDGYHELGLFISAAQVNLLVTAFMTVFAQISTSLLSESAGQSSSSDIYSHRLNLTLRFNLSTACAAGLAVSLWPAGAVAIFGVDFSDTSKLIPLTLAFAAVNVGCGTCGQFFSSAGRMWLGLAMTMLWGVIFLGFFIVLGAGSGARGLALSLLVAYWLVLIVQLFLMIRIQGPRIMEGLPWSIGFLSTLTAVALLQSLGSHVEIARMLAVIALIGLGIRFILFDGKPLFSRISLRRLQIRESSPCKIANK